jgi:ABC-type sugar transport system permease subunit
MYNPAGGLLAGVQRSLGLGSGIDYLGSAGLAIFSIAVVNVRQWTGFSLLLGSSALQNVPKEVTDAAVVDGAGLLTVARKILVPYLRPATITLIILGVIGSLQTFALVFVMTGGGPGDASQVLGTYIYKVAFSENEFSYGSTVSVALLVVTLFVTLVQLGIVSRMGREERKS